MKLNKRLGILMVLILGLAVLLGTLNKTPDEQTHAGLTPVAPTLVPSPEPPPGVYSSYKERDLKAAHDLAQVAQVSPREASGFLRRLKMFRQYSRKVLKTEGEVRILHELVADEAMQDVALQNLNSKANEDERIVIVDYILAGLDEQKNLDRSPLREKVIGFLQSEISRELDKKTIKSLAGDRVELFAAVLEIEPRSVEPLMANPTSELNKRIYQYAMLNYGKKGR